MFKKTVSIVLESDLLEVNEEVFKNYELTSEILDDNNLKLTGQKSKIINFLTVSDYALEYSEMYEKYPHLKTDFKNITYLVSDEDDEKESWKPLNEDTFGIEMYNNQSIIIKDSLLNKIIQMSINYDEDISYKIFNVDSEINDFNNNLKNEFILKDMLDGVLDNKVGWCTAPRDALEQILEVSSNIKRDYKEILEKYLSKEIIEKIQKKCKETEFSFYAATKDIIEYSIVNKTNNQIPGSAFKDILFCEEDTLNFCFSKLTDSFENIVYEMKYIDDINLELDDAKQIIQKHQSKNQTLDQK